MATHVTTAGDAKTRSLPFQDTFSKLLRLPPNLLTHSNARNLRLGFICVFGAKHVWELFLILKNLWCIWDFGSLPPPEYEIPPGGPEIETWKNECALARKKCEYHFVLNLYDFAVISGKLFTDYFPSIWGRTGAKVTGMLPRALWFIAIDLAITNVGRFFSNMLIAIVVGARHTRAESFQEEVESITKPGRGTTYDPLEDFKVMICGAIVYDMFGLTGVAWLVFLDKFLDSSFYRKFDFETTSYSQIAKSTLPGCQEIIALAEKMAFFKRDLLLLVGDNGVPQAIHYNFITSDTIVITKSLLENLPPNQSKSVVGLAMVHWKAGYCYWDHLGHLVFLCTKLCICALLQEVPSFFNIEEEVHPAVPAALIYTVIFPVVDDVAYGFAGWIHTLQKYNCDKSIEDAYSSLVYLKQALVRLADLPGSQKFDSWYSSWFFGSPSLVDRITRIRRRNSSKTIHT